MEYNWLLEPHVGADGTKLLGNRMGLPWRGMGYPYTATMHRRDIIYCPNRPQRNAVNAYLLSSEWKLSTIETLFKWGRLWGFISFWTCPLGTRRLSKTATPIGYTNIWASRWACLYTLIQRCHFVAAAEGDGVQSSLFFWIILLRPITCLHGLTLPAIPLLVTTWTTVLMRRMR